MNNVDNQEPLSNIFEDFENIIEKLSSFKLEINTIQQQLKTIEKKVKKEMKSLKKAVNKKKNKGNKAPSGFAKPTKVSKELCNFLNKKEGSEIARTEVTSFLSSYIRSNNL